MSNVIDLTGERFGRLFVKSRAENNKSNRAMWECVCDCGNVKVTLGYSLRSGITRSCGCLNDEMLVNRSKKHGMSNTRFFRIWQGMKSRCQNKNRKSYSNYGAKGISVCERWQDFENFKEDMYDNYIKHVNEHGEQQTTLDRIDSNGGYTPTNTRWATLITQSRNRRAQSGNETGHRGVTKVRSGKFLSCIRVDGSLIRLGTHENIDDAISARKEAEAKYWNEN